MKKYLLFPSFLMVFSLAAVSCKKCQSCTTKTMQNVWGYEQTTSTTNEYCGDEYDNAPEPGTYSQNTGGVEQQVEITCKED